MRGALLSTLLSIVLTFECRGLTLSLPTSVGSIQFRVPNPDCGAPMSLLKIASVPPATVEPQASVLEAVETMAEHGVGAVAVVEKGELRGIFTERDLMLRVVLRSRHPKDTRVGEVMTAPVETIVDESGEDDALVH